MSTFARFSEQPDAGRLLDAALREGPAHAYLFHGPAGVGKREAAHAFARALLDTTRDFHPDLYELDALGEMIRIDAIRELRRDLHLRPFEADRRVYLVQRAHLMNEDAADALLKDLEEPPSYAVIVLVADDLGPLPETIRSRCQLVPFRRLSEPAMRELVDARAPQLDDEARAALARVAARPPRPVGAAARSGLGSTRGGADRAGARRLPLAELRRRRLPPRRSPRTRRRSRPARGSSRRRASRISSCRRARPSSGCAVLRAARSARSCSPSWRSSRAWYRDLVAVAVGADERGDPPRQAAGAARGRDPRAPRRRRARRRGSARDLARASRSSSSHRSLPSRRSSYGCSASSRRRVSARVTTRASARGRATFPGGCRR